MTFRTTLCAAALFCAFASQAQTVLTVSSWLPPHHTASVSQQKWCEAVEQESKGSLKCNILPKPVAAPPGTFDAVRDGLADVSYSVDGYTPGRFVFTQVAEFPFLGNSAEETSVAYNRIYQKHLAPAGEHKGVKVLGVFTHGPGVIFNAKKPVTSAADVASLKFRIGGGNIAELSKAMGWNVTLKPASESYELLSTGVMDGTFLPDETVGSLKLTMIKHATRFPGGLYNSSFAFLMNPDRYKSLSPAHKAVVDKLSGEYVGKLFGQGWDAQDRVAREGAQQAQGVQNLKATDAFVNEIKVKQGALEDRWVAAAEARGLKNAKAVLAEFRAEIAKGN